MQSELACHIGSMGKLFCRICTVKGSDAADSTDQAAPDQQPDAPVPSSRGATPPHAGNSGEETADSGSASEAGAPRKGRKKKVESMAEMAARVSRFVKVSIQPSRMLLELIIDLDRLVSLEQRTKQ